jgi:hypothetical protein
MMLLIPYWTVVASSVFALVLGMYVGKVLL